MPDSLSVFGNASRTPDSESNALDVLFGTAAETAVDVGSFGILQPDIISDLAEAQHPMATTIGRVAGTLAGFVPSFGASSLAVKGIYGVFKFSSSIFKTAQTIDMAATAVNASLTANAIKGAAAGKMFSAPLMFRSATQAAPVFALYDTAREFVRQTKEDDPDVAALGWQALRGAGTGWFMGSIAGGFSIARPVTQAIAMGTTMAGAETTFDAWNGEDVLSAEYATQKLIPNIALGVAMGLYGSIGWEQRREELVEAGLKGGHAELQNWQNTTIMDKLKADGITTPEEYLKAITITEPTGNVPLDEFPQNIQFMRLLWDSFKKWDFTAGNKLRPAQARMHTVKNSVGLPDADYQNILKEFTGKSSSKDLTVDDYITLESQLRQTVGVEKYDKIVPKARLNIDMKTFGPLQQTLSMPDTAAMTNGWWGFVQHMHNAKAYQLIFKEKQNLMVDAFIGKYTELFDKGIKDGKVTPIAKQPVIEGMSVGQKVFSKISPLPSHAMVDLSARLESGNLAGLTGPLKSMVKEYRDTQAQYLDMLNATRGFIGQKAMKPKEFYMRHVVDIPAMLRAGISREEMATQQIKSGKMKTAEDFLVGTEYQRRKGIPYVNDAGAALRNMIQVDVQAIFLREPWKILNTSLRNVLKTNPELKPQVDDIVEHINKIMFEKPSKSTTYLTNRTLGFLKDNKVGNALDSFFAGAGIDVGKRPFESASGAISNWISQAYVAFNPALDFLNAVQWSYTVPTVTAGNAWRGLITKDTALLAEIKKNSLYYKMAVGKPLENLTEKGALAQSGFINFLTKNKLAIDTSMRMKYHQGREYIWNPKYKSVGAASTEGTAKRAELRTSGNANWMEYMTKSERHFLERYVDESANSANFLYNVLGAPYIQRSAVARPFVTLTSYPMNYVYKYLNELGTIAMTGTPHWAKAEGLKIKLPLTERLGIIKHLVGVAVIAGAVEKYTGFDYSQLGIVSLTKQDKNHWYNIGDENWGVAFGGVLNIRPNPATSLVLAVKDALTSDDTYVRNMAMSNIKRLNFVPIPYSGVVRKAIGTAEGRREPYQMFVYKKYERKKTAVFQPTPTLAQTARKYGLTNE